MSAAAVASVSWALKRPRSKSIATMGRASTTRPTVAGTFSISASAVTEDTTATIKAWTSGGQQVAYVTAQPLLQLVRVYQTSVTGGTVTSGSVVLNAAAPAGGVVVSLASSSGVASVPGTVSRMCGEDAIVMRLLAPYRTRGGLC